MNNVSTKIALRIKRRALGLCRECGKVKSNHYRCSKCNEKWKVGRNAWRRRNKEKGLCSDGGEYKPFMCKWENHLQGCWRKGLEARKMGKSKYECPYIGSNAIQHQRFVCWVEGWQDADEWLQMGLIL